MQPSASLTLPPVTMSGEYIMEDHDSHSDAAWGPDDFPAKQGNYLQGNYLRCVAEVMTWGGLFGMGPHKLGFLVDSQLGEEGRALSASKWPPDLISVCRSTQ